MKKILLVIFSLFTIVFGNSLSQIENSKEIRIGVWLDQAPFSSYKDGEFSGFEIDMANTIGKKIVGKDGKITLVGIPSVEERIPFLKENKVDIVIASFTKTPEREKEIDFSYPYFYVAPGFLVNKNNGYFDSVNQLVGKKISIQKGAQYSYELAKKFNISLVEVDTVPQQYKLLKEKKVDAMLNDNLIVMSYPIIDDSVVVPVKFRNVGISSFLAPGVSKGNEELRKKLNTIMIELSKQGFFKDAFDKTFGVFYRGNIDSKYFILESFYKIFG